MCRLSVCLLGRFRAAIEGEEVTGFRSDKVRALLAYLVVESDTPHRRERLAGLLWPDRPERSARADLRVALANLRQIIGDHEAQPPFLLISRQTIQFNQSSDARIDTQSLESLFRTGQPAVELMEEAVELYRGEFMAGFSLPDSPLFEEWALLAREQLHRLVMEALQRLADSLEGRGESERALGYAWRQVDLDPWREAAHRQVMRLLAHAGQRSAALAQYQHCREVLQQELGVDVSEQTRQLYEELMRGEGLPGVTAPVTWHHLPAQATSFEGREEELAEIEKLLSNPSCRLLSLVGPGGIGKTRLALEAATREARSYQDGVYFVPLAHISSPKLVTSGVADALRLELGETASELDPKTQILDYLRDRAVLLLMDSFEHLVEGSGLLADVLEQAPNVRFLVTSRERLCLRGEWVLDVQGMSYPENGDDGAIEAYGALKLFLARARQSDRGFTLSADVRPHVNHVCQLVEGMPLGIELAAAWVSVLSCQEIATEIAEGIGVLATPARDVPDRHRSVRAAFDHSWRLLTKEAQSGFRKLSVFRGGFSREAVREVAGVEFVLLSELVNKSLLRRNAQGRYEIHELLRQYAAEKLDALPEEWQQVQERHSRYFVQFISVRERELYGERLREIKREIRSEIENVRAAVRWAIARWSEGEARDALASLEAVFTVEGWHEGKETFAGIVRALQKTREVEADAATPGSSPLLSAMVYQAMYGSLLGETDASEEILQECLPGLGALGLNRELAVCHFALGVNALYQGEFERAQQRFEENISLARAGQAKRWVAHGQMWLGWALGEAGDLEGAKAQYQESYCLYQEEGSRWGMAFVLSKQGLIADAEKDHSQAKRYHHEALQVLSGFGDRAGQAYVTSRLSLTAYSQGDYTEAWHVGRRGYELFDELGHRWGKGASLCRIGFAALGLGRRGEARTCFRKAHELATGMQHVPLILCSLAGMAGLLAEEGDEAQAVELLTFVEEHPQTPPVYLDSAARWFSDIETRLSPEELSAARERGRASELEGVGEGVLRERPRD